MHRIEIYKVPVAIGLLGLFMVVVGWLLPSAEGLFVQGLMKDVKIGFAIIGLLMLIWGTLYGLHCKKVADRDWFN